MDKNNLELFSDELVFLDFEVISQFDFFEKISSMLFAKGYVVEEFFEKILERERKYPTGLPIQPYPVAIPHCDAKYVKKESISVVRFKNFVEFVEMGTEDHRLQCKFAFVLTIKEKKQISILGDLIKVFQNQPLMEALMQAKTAKEVVDLLFREQKGGQK